MRDLLPEFVVVEVAGDDDWTGALLPDEAAHLSPRAVEGRRREYTAGRVCARRALQRVGIHGQPVLAAPSRAPIWPAGAIGSITHTKGYCAVAVGLVPDLRAVGIDAERRTVLPANIVPSICLPEEIAWCAQRPDEPWWPAVHFSAKETVYKMWSPIMGTWLDFHDARLTIDVAAGTFEAAILPEKLEESPGAPAVFRGRFAVEPDLIRTAGHVDR
ncbi:4'-phosphopantetheinyl transferase superfamily protein [Dactylosporangium aurantiacum]|uniref:4'-phosphopantetheinyl transferase superfamily protein n=1 Tax=Dactylosporangium aurantiacum TaxID=35754 RepID=A0A9Q9MBM8_9ACTN|nr:4'-phosphopantetheinyl transferase superfamily protein [Dactylosporangium aurantiacum]MDG6102656.1 4'-phosphopantetheinyl transferase superfamily protein [Dactylosporangium aurantiacum]UWZ53093.1 4'-phosphopantetheinyl transferase superfamily protein [Dactylosporangium aurantiacum]